MSRHACSVARGGTKRGGGSAREILRNAIKNEGVQRTPLGGRLRARFSGIGLEDDLPELRGEIARPATFEE
jgi:hypothetical protein